jgi:hypothetical protein
MADINDQITAENIKSNLFDNSFKDKPHQVFVVYDNLMDEMIVRLNAPDSIAAEFSISDSLSLLVDPDTHEVVGLQLLEFTTEHLPQMEGLRDFWSRKDLPRFFSTYRVCTYKPPQKPVKESYYFYSPQKIEMALSPC